MPENGKYKFNALMGTGMTEPDLRCLKSEGAVQLPVNQSMSHLRIRILCTMLCQDGLFSESLLAIPMVLQLNHSLVSPP